MKGEPAPRAVPEFIEWWLEFPGEFIVPGAPPPPAPPDDCTRELLMKAAKIAAGAWAKEIKTAKGWESEPAPLLAPAGSTPPLPFVPAWKAKGAK
ncbi:hypothetical protein AnaeK_1534 [Anaeromyxobacter sp. K]|nr:hypothetical protein AnaeK_1534 [Anaeromyxobacter sp. K]